MQENSWNGLVYDYGVLLWLESHFVLSSETVHSPYLHAISCGIEIISFTCACLMFQKLLENCLQAFNFPETSEHRNLSSRRIICSSSGCISRPSQMPTIVVNEPSLPCSVQSSLKSHQSKTRPHIKHILFPHFLEMLFIPAEQTGATPELLPFLRRGELGDAGFYDTNGLSIPSIAFVERIG